MSDERETIVIENESFDVIKAEEVCTSVLHTEDGAVISTGIGDYAVPEAGQKLSRVLPGGVLFTRVDDVLKVKPWVLGTKPRFKDLLPV